MSRPVAGKKNYTLLGTITYSPPKSRHFWNFWVGEFSFSPGKRYGIPMYSWSSPHSCHKKPRRSLPNGVSGGQDCLRRQVDNVFLARFWSNPGDNLIRGFAISCPETFQILIFHQPRFLWNKGISLPQLPFEVRSCEVAIIWRETSLPSCQRYVRMMFKPKKGHKPCLTRYFKQSIHYFLHWIGESNKIEG